METFFLVAGQLLSRCGSILTVVDRQQKRFALCTFPVWGALQVALCRAREFNREKFELVIVSLRNQGQRVAARRLNRETIVLRQQ